MGHYASVYFSPNRGTINEIIGFIDRCEETIEAAVYSLTHDDVATALIRAHGRGVKVRILTDNLQASGAYSDDERLVAAGVEVRQDKSSGAMHHKFVVGDGNAVGTGSFNWTASAESRNAENFVVLRLLYIVDSFQKEFEALWVMHGPEA